MRIVAKTETGYLMAVSASELTTIGAALEGDNWGHKTVARIGLDVDVKKIADDARLIRASKTQLSQCVNTLRSVADLIAAQPCYVAEPKAEEKPS